MYCSLALPLAVYVFSWEPSVWSGACIAGGRGGRARRPAPSRAQEGGREHPRRGRPPGPASPPSCGARSETFVRRPLDQFFASSGASLPPPIPARSAEPGRRGSVVERLGTQCAPPQPLARPPAPPPRSRSLRKLRPSWLLRSRGGPSRRQPPPWEAACFLNGAEGRVEDVVSRSPAARGAGRGTGV